MNDNDNGGGGGNNITTTMSGDPASAPVADNATAREFSNDSDASKKSSASNGE